MHSRLSNPQFAFTLEVLLGPQISDREEVLSSITYGEHFIPSISPRLHIKESHFFRLDCADPGGLPSLPLHNIDGVPLLYGHSIIKRMGQSLVIHADIIASAYFLLTRYEEVVRRDVRDKHGRFPGKESLPYRAGFLHRPIVDEYGALLRKWLREVGVAVPEPNRRFSVALTHDIDTLGPRKGCSWAFRSFAKGLLGRMPFLNTLNDCMISTGLKQHAFDNIIDVIAVDSNLRKSESHPECRSIFFMLAPGGESKSMPYDLRSRHIRRMIRYIFDSGGDIGLHTSLDAAINPTLISDERNRLERATGTDITSNRHHFLCSQEPEHLTTLAESGITDDYTMGYPDVVGFRLGTCRPVRWFDPVAKKLTNLTLHPLTVMDCTLDRKENMGLDEMLAFEQVKTLAEVTAQHNGEFTCLWHNTSLASDEAGYHRRLYDRMLVYLGMIKGENCARP